MICPESVVNGSIWQAKWPLCWTAVVIWVDGGEDAIWLLVSTKHPMIPFERDGKVLLTIDEVCALLKQWGAVEAHDMRMELRSVGETPEPEWDGVSGVRVR